VAEVKGRAALGISAEDQTGPGTQSAIKNMNRITEEAEKAQGRMSASSQKGKNRFGRGIAELSRGVEDFGQQLSVSFDMAVRASANNLTQFTHVLNPLAGTLTSIGIAAYFMAPAIASLFKTGAPTMDAEDFNTMLGQTLDTFRRNRDIERFKKSLEGMDAKKAQETIRDLQKDTEMLSDEIDQLRKNLEIAFIGIDPEIRSDLAAIAFAPKQQLEQMSQAEEEMRKRIRALRRPPSAGSMGPRQPISRKDKLAAEELEKELERIRKTLGLVGTTSIADLLSQLEELEKRGVDIGKIEAEIRKRRNQQLDNQKKINAAKKAEFDLTKRIADQMQLIATIQPRTQKFVELLARTQLRGDLVGGPVLQPELPEVPDAPAAPAAPAEPAVPGEDPFSEFLRPDRGALFFGNEGQDLENFDDIFNEGLGALKRDADGADAARNDLLKKNNELAQDIIDAVEDSSRMRAKIVNF
jgi:hypothetical protein